MKLTHKAERPVDRAVQELDEQIAQLERQLRHLEHRPGATIRPANQPDDGALTEKVSTFVRTMLKPSEGAATPSYRARKDLFDVVDTPLKELEAEPIAFARRAVEPDLFTTPPAAAVTPEKPAAKDEKLLRYLGVGGIRTYKPTKSIQRRDRNRFLLWIGLAIAAVWVLIVVLR